jgi:hypothetical protein
VNNSGIEEEETKKEDPGIGDPFNLQYRTSNNVTSERAGEGGEGGETEQLHDMRATTTN